MHLIDSLARDGGVVADDKTLSVIIGQYNTVEDAVEDLGYVLEDRDEHLYAVFDGAVVSKDETGHVSIVRKHETPVSMGAWGGLVVGAVIGLVYPPALLELGAVGAAAGAIVGHLSRGMSNADIKELGDSLDAATAALVIAVDSESAGITQSIMGRAQSITVKSVAAKASDIDAAIEQASKA